MSNKFIVIGAGALGLATTEGLLRQGVEVTVLERGQVGQESSWAGGGILSPLCPWDYPDAVNRLAARGAQLFAGFAQRLLDETGIDPEFNRCGMWVLPPFDVPAARQWCQAHGVRAEKCGDATSVLSFPQKRESSQLNNLARQEQKPVALSTTTLDSRFRGNDNARDALFLPDVAQARNPRLLQAMRAQVLKLGGRIVEQCDAQQLVEKANKVSHLVTSQGDFSAENFIVTAGAWSKTLLGEHALSADIKPIRGQMLLFKFETPPLPYVVLQDGLYLIPRKDGHLLVGSTLEDVGFDKSTTQEARAMLLQRATALLPSLRDMPIVKHWAGLRPASPGNLPTIGRHPHLHNLFINSGHFRYGVTMSPASAEILLNEINGTVQALDVAPYQWR